MTLAAFLLAFGATARITRFVNDDYLAEPLRNWVFDRFGQESRLAYLATCPWCLSPWVAAAVVLAAYWLGDTGWYIIPASILTISYGYGLLAQAADGEE